MTLLMVRLPRGKGRRSRSVQIIRANSVYQNEIFRVQPRLAGPFVGVSNFRVVEAGRIWSVNHWRAVHFVMTEEHRLCLGRIFGQSDVCFGRVPLSVVYNNARCNVGSFTAGDIRAAKVHPEPNPSNAGSFGYGVQAPGRVADCISI